MWKIRVSTFILGITLSHIAAAKTVITAFHDLRSHRMAEPNPVYTLVVISPSEQLFEVAPRSSGSGEIQGFKTTRLSHRLEEGERVLFANKIKGMPSASYSLLTLTKDKMVREMKPIFQPIGNLWSSRVTDLGFKLNEDETIVFYEKIETHNRLEYSFIVFSSQGRVLEQVFVYDKTNHSWSQREKELPHQLDNDEKAIAAIKIKNGAQSRYRLLTQTLKGRVFEKRPRYDDENSTWRIEVNELDHKLEKDERVIAVMDQSIRSLPWYTLITEKSDGQLMERRHVPHRPGKLVVNELEYVIDCQGLL